MEKKTLQQTKNEVSEIFQKIAKDERYSTRIKEDFFFFCKWEIYSNECVENLNSKNIEESYKKWSLTRKLSFIKLIFNDVLESRKYKLSTIQRFFLAVEKLTAGAPAKARRLKEKKQMKTESFDDELPF